MNIFAEMRAQLLALKEPQPGPPLPAPTMPAESPQDPQDWHPSPDRRHGPLMPLARITYLQVYLWDNGPEKKQFYDKRKKKMVESTAPRHKVSIDAWHLPADQIKKWAGGNQSVERRIQLRTPHGFQKRILDVNLKKGKITQQTYDAVLAIMLRDTNFTEDLFGWFTDNKDGYTIFPTQLFHVTYLEGKPVLTIYRDDETLKLSEFTNEHLTEGQKSKGAIFSQFYDSCNYFETQRRYPTKDQDNA